MLPTCRAGSGGDSQRRASLGDRGKPEAPHTVMATSGTAAAAVAAGHDMVKDLMSWDDDVPDAHVPAAGGCHSMVRLSYFWPRACSL